MSRPPTRSALRLTIPLVVGALLYALLSPSPALAGGSDVGDYLARINALRSSVGVQALTPDGELTAGAQSWADHLAATGVLAHAPDITAGITADWRKVGENVGDGPSTATVWTAFLNSAAHYRNLVDPAFNRVGVGVTWAGARQWTCHRFMQVAGSNPPPPPPSTQPPATTAPRPEPKPTPTPAVRPTTAPSSGASSGSGTAGSDSGASTTPVAPPAPQAGPPPPADPARVAAVLAALRQLNP